MGSIQGDDCQLNGDLACENAEIRGQLRAGSAIIGGQSIVESIAIPARTLFVSPVWPSGADPTQFFTTIQGAIDQANTLVPPPSQANPVAIQISPGSYPGAVVMTTGIVLNNVAGVFPEVLISGAISWTPTGAVFETIWLFNLRTTGAITIDTTGKTGGQTTTILNGCFSDMLTYTGRANAGPTRDFFFATNCVPGVAAFTFTTGQIEWLAGRLSGFTFNGACLFSIVGSTTVPTATTAYNVNGTSTGTAIGCLLTTPWNVAAGASVTSFAGSSLTDPLTVALGGTSDVRGANYNGNANLVGPGTINRTTHTESFGPTVVGANPIVFAVPFPDAAYNVALQLTAGPGNAAVTVTAKAGTGFTITDAVGGNTFDITVIHD